jgi:hypothetical protein
VAHLHGGAPMVWMPLDSLISAPPVLIYVNPSNYKFSKVLAVCYLQREIEAA